MTNDLIHQPDEGDALASPEASRRASNVAKDLRKRAKEKGVSVETLFRPISSETSQATFYRRIGPDDLIEVGSHRKTTQDAPSPQGDGNKQKQWPLKLISLLAACAPAVADVDPDELRAEMLGRGTSNNPELLLIVYGRRYRDSAAALKAMDLKLTEYGSVKFFL